MNRRCVTFDAGDATTPAGEPAVPFPRPPHCDLRSVERVTLQSMFVRDAHGRVDNAVPRAIDAWLKAVDRIRTAEVDIETLARRPVQPSLGKGPEPVLE